MPSGIIQGASYADVHARMPAALALTAAALVGAALAVASAIGGSRRLLIAGAVLYAVTMLGGSAYAAMLQRFAVTPNEQVRETPFMEYNIAATRAAFALDQVEERELPGEAALTRADIEANRETLDNVRLWDHQPLLETFGQIQEIRTYYDFVSVDNDRYRINGQNRQVMLSVRELNPAALPNRTWVNERLVFTHGHGLTLGPVNQVTAKACRCCSSAICRRSRPSTSTSPNRASTSASSPATTSSSARTRRSSTIRRAKTTSTTSTPARAACRSDRCGASCCSRSGSVRIRSC